MKIFQTIQKHYAILGISPSNQLTQKLSFDKRVAFGFLLFGYSVGSRFVYIVHVANGFLEYMECICATSGTIIVFVCFVAIVFERTLLFKCIDIIEKLIDTRCKYPESRRFFLKTSQRVERLSEIVFSVVVKISLQFVTLPKCIVSFGVYFITDSGCDSFQLPIPMWFPFASDNPIGYLIAIILEYILLGYDFFKIAFTLALIVGACWFLISMTKEIQRILHSIKYKVRSNKNQSNELKILFSEFIDTHGISKQVEHDISDIFQPIFMSLFTWSLLSISAALLMIQVEIVHHGNVMVLFLPLINGIIGLTTVFICCELGQRLTDAFDEIYFTSGQLDWYLLPIEIKQMLSMTIAIAQEPVTLECFGSMTCGREVFKNVIHCAFSYFMVLRQLGN